MPTTDYKTMSDAALEAKRNEIQLQIEGLQRIFMAMGLELERRRQTGEVVKDTAALQVEIASLRAQLEAQQAAEKPRSFIQRLFGSG